MFSGVVADSATHVIGARDFKVEIATECAGFEGIGLIWVFLGAYLWAFRRSLRFPEAFWLIPIGTGVMWVANALRIVLLVAIGTLWSEKVALGGFHSQAGWLAFNGVALGLVAASRRVRAFQIDPTTPAVEARLRDRSSVNPNIAAYLGLMLAPGRGRDDHHGLVRPRGPPASTPFIPARDRPRWRPSCGCSVEAMQM